MWFLFNKWKNVIARITSNVNFILTFFLKFLLSVVESGNTYTCISVQFSRSVVSYSLRPHESQHAKPPCPSPTPGVYPNPCSSSRWCHPLVRWWLSHPLSSPSPPAPIPPSIRVFSSESTFCIRWPKYWSFSFNIIPSNEHSGLISFRMDWLDLLAVQGTLKNLLQHHSSKHLFFCTQLSSRSNSHIRT